MTPQEYWQSGAGLGNITPPGVQWPEGPGFGEFLTGMIGDHSVLEIGCGVGRLAALFDPLDYIGIDICPEAIKRAKASLPRHWFITDVGRLPTADVTLLHTVLLHVPDESLSAFVARLNTPRVLVSEILGRHWRREGDPPVFNRDVVDYMIAFAEHDYALTGVVTHPYPHYRDTVLSVLEFIHT